MLGLECLFNPSSWNEILTSDFFAYCHTERSYREILDDTIYCEESISFLLSYTAPKGGKIFGKWREESNLAHL